MSAAVTAGRLRDLAGRLSAGLAARREELEAAVVAELGFVRRDAAAELAAVTGLLDTGVGPLTERMAGRRPLCRQGQEVALLLPYNMSAGALWDIVRLRAGGNPVRVRFSDRAGAVARIVAEVLATAGDPGLRVVRAGRDDFLRRVLGSADVPLLVAYGGEGLGRRLLARVVGGRQRVVFEGPGKDPFLVLEGTPLPAALDDLVRAKLQYGGQQCVAPELVLVHGDLHDDLVDGLVRRLRGVRLGDPGADGTDLGPVASPAVAGGVRAQLADALATGCSVVAGGSVDGCWVEPTVVCGVTPRNLLWRDETFAPVLGIAAYRTEDDALDLARSLRFGLHATVYGPRASEVARRLRGAAYAAPVTAPRAGRFGVVTENRMIYDDPRDFLAPFGGYGESGWTWKDGVLHQGPVSFTDEASLPAPR